MTGKQQINSFLECVLIKTFLDLTVKLTKVLKYFSMYEICRTAIFQFPETNLYEIQRIIARKNDVMSKKNIIRELLFVVNALSDKELNSRYFKLLLLGKFSKVSQISQK